ncbi:putative bifunctional diguanylate cyclase/phosphodiesterase [Methylocystis parvus]|uniref:EAL domain-containing protein n=1 Tax=Methylocystis parvus TaxID=134 RepID=A0A6B8M9I6_9HYPH|nr:EAL domain-containing protein [Methylocystis parvus]QGM97953.1 EAL domain-containing protein [Methylocystis parvus]WBK01733.1 EAL domain-containing protein [Methylocystis parvus OBBP]
MKEKVRKARHDAIIDAQFEAIARHVPALYFTVSAFVCFLIIILKNLASPAFFFIWGGALICGAAFRARHWIKLRKLGAHMTTAQKLGQIERTTRVGILVCVALCGVAVVVARAPSPTLQAVAMMLIWSAAVGAAFNVAVLPSASGGILLIATAATAAVFFHSGDPLLAVAIPALCALAGAIWDLLAKNFDGFSALVHSNVENAFLRREAVQMATTDALTSLPNRRAFDERLRELSASDRRFAVAMIDLDGFKPVNDLHGHIVGDLFLAEAAKRLSARVESAGLLARMGGDEFALLIEGFRSQEDVVAVTRRLVDALSAPFVHERATAHMSCSCGVALRYEGEEAGRLLERADMALYEAKAKARGGIVLFSDELERVALRHTIVSHDLRAAIESDAFQMAFQPIVDLRTGALSGFEALARWRHPELGSVPPDVFIPMAEKSGLIAPLSALLLRRAARAARDWPSHLTLSFNLSAAQTDQPGTALAILSIIEDCGLPPSRLEIELTETAVLADLAIATRTISGLATAGIHISLDDFGAGYSSFGQLCDLALDKVKIDKSFVDRIVTERRAASIVGAIIGMCDGLNMQCVAEGIETQAQFDKLRALGCHKGQGYLISPPLPEEELIGFIARAERKVA